MINLNEYIIEKLKINKDSKWSRKINLDDEISILSLYFNNPWDKEIELRIRRPFKVKEINDNKLIYISPYNGKEIEHEYYINSKEYYQSDSKESGGKNAGRIYGYAIFMHADEYKKILELILKEKVFNPKYSDEGSKKIIDLLIKDYFDNINMKELNNRKILYYDFTSNSGVVGTFKRPKELKEVIDTYYAKY